MVTPFQEILHTNAVPSDAECQRIRELLVGPRRVAAELSDEIERLQGLIHQLTEKRAHLNDFIDAHAALISPVRRLPEDVVAEIFAASLPSDRNAIMSGAESPLLLCHVCKAWRNLALLTPFLWTSLHIVAPTDPSKARTGFHFPNIAQLSKIHVHFVRPMYVDIVSALQPAIADGLDITLRYTDPPPKISASQGNVAYTRELLSDTWESGH
ncbi:hypothetical protein B0H13DRAFT_2657103 [Mycena leptocephala]|nr:hypothetical protein B0H13DRAFT_2657103 [Mycena leptocephala]